MSLLQKVKTRKKNLKLLWGAIESHETELLEALHKDLNKPEAEALLQEIYPLKKEYETCLRNIYVWSGKRKVSTPLALMGTRHYVLAEPKGKVLIISPWNFPAMLTLRPLFSALASGNMVVVKPSEHTPNTSNVIKKLIESVFDNDTVSVRLGGPEVAAELTSQPFDHICFTGGTEIGKLVMKAAAENLCSVTLELGGKSPVIVDKSAHLGNTALRVAWGKYMNAGQVCIAPDYMLVEKKMEDDMVKALTDRIVTMFGDNPIDSEDLGAIVNERHYNRILGLIKEAVKSGAKLHVPGGVLEIGKGKRKIAPCILTECTTDMEIMKEEIFGPVLPVLSWESKNEVLEIVAKNPNPLALYIFSSKSRNINFFTENTKAGSTAINEVIIQIANPEMGFGGIGNSGMGRSNGKASFDAFSNLRTFVSATTRFNLLPLTFPPFGKFGLRISRLIRKWG